MTIHQEVTIAAKPEAIYALLTTAEKFSAMTGGAPAKIPAEVGGAVSLFDGQITAQHVHLEPSKRVVQAWRASSWPDGVYSLVTFDLAADGNGTKVVFDQVGHPDDAAEMLEGGWHQMYWKPMEAYLASA